jgi:hypothetical protein
VALTPHELTLHGHRISYRTGGRGPALRFAALLREFCEETEAARLTADHWRPVMGDGTPT